MKHTIIFGLLLCATLAGFTQGANRAVGIRGGLSSGFEYRVFSEEQGSYKVLLSTRKDGLQLTGLKEFHRPNVFDAGPEVSFIYGVGAHVGFESWYVDRYHPNAPYDWWSAKRTGVIAGLDALAGLEYTIPTLPLVAGIEAKPYFNLFGKNFFDIQPFDFAFTLKYVF
ncbi:MAG TPA: hypothetical protein VFG54_06250 [Prolixibacteraceae bacterium]|nr:hypothetical protein [Prolixibacteraceae bacterium]